MKFVDFDSDILEIGCGCGRNALVLRKYSLFGLRYSGDFLGVDIDAEAVLWCQNNIANENFHFHVSPHASKFYLKEDEATDQIQIPLEAKSRDFVFATAVFGHLLEPELRNYISEAARVLRPGGHIFFSFRCLEFLPDDFGRQFRQSNFNSYVLNPEKPEQSVAYRFDTIVSMMSEYGFQSVNIGHRGGRTQTLTATAS